MCSEKGDVQLYSPRDFSGVATPVRQVEKDGASTVHFVARHAGSPWDRRANAPSEFSRTLALHTPALFFRWYETFREIANPSGQGHKLAL